MNGCLSLCILDGLSAILWKGLASRQSASRIWGLYMYSLSLSYTYAPKISHWNVVLVFHATSGNQTILWRSKLFQLKFTFLEKVKISFKITDLHIFRQMSVPNGSTYSCSLCLQDFYELLNWFGGCTRESALILKSFQQVPQSPNS